MLGLEPLAVQSGLDALMAGTHDVIEVLVTEPTSRHQRRHLLLFNHFPVDERFDVGMIHIQDHHLGRPAGGAAGLDGTGCPVADLEEGHQA